MKAIAAFLFLTIVLFFVEANAQILPRLGENKVATTSGQFLKIGVGARAAALGESFVALADDPSTLYWNPSGIARLPSQSAYFSHTDWAVDFDYDFGGYIHKFERVGTFGISFGALHTDDMPVTDEYHPQGTGEYFNYLDYFVGLTYASTLTDRFSMGATIKYAREELDDLIMQSWLVDIGTHYHTGFRTIRFAVSIVNFGPNMQPDGKRSDGDSYEDFSPPTIFRFGVAMDPFDRGMHRITTSIQVNHPVDNAENINFGVEYWWREMFALRTGWRTGVDEGGLSAGMGFKLSLGMVSPLAFDYGYSDFDRLGAIHRFSLGLSL
ncbi:MAG: hypothetical protein B6244_02745 [Candidatus Cloacimonetes bacterium 4572_55]|nr:MAG: hypothetical protein B6244_02745 [Candidatus Cloacimonetes bacterium 4572_55]